MLSVFTKKLPVHLHRVCPYLLLEPGRRAAVSFRGGGFSFTFRFPAIQAFPHDAPCLHHKESHFRAAVQLLFPPSNTLPVDTNTLPVRNGQKLLCDTRPWMPCMELSCAACLPRHPTPSSHPATTNTSAAGMESRISLGVSIFPLCQQQITTGNKVATTYTQVDPTRHSLVNHMQVLNQWMFKSCFSFQRFPRQQPCPNRSASL